MFKISEVFLGSEGEDYILTYDCKYYFYKYAESINGYTDKLLFNGGLYGLDVIYSISINKNKKCLIV